MMYSEKMELPIVFDMVDSIGLNYQEAPEKDEFHIPQIVL